MTQIQLYAEKYRKRNLVTFGLNLRALKNSKGVIKKDLHPPPPKRFNDFTIDTPNLVNPSHNALGMRCGHANGIFVIDVDDVNDWHTFLKDNQQLEGQFDSVVRQTSAKGGFHLFFKYSSDLDSFKGKEKCFGKKYSIDSRTNGNFIFATPTSYFGSVLYSESNETVSWEYSWNIGRSIFDIELTDLPEWMKQKLNTSENVPSA